MKRTCNVFDRYREIHQLLSKLQVMLSHLNPVSAVKTIRAQVIRRPLPTKY